MKFSKYVILPLIFVFLIADAGGQPRKTKQTAKIKEQNSFSSESKVSNAVKLPSNILRQLAEYDDGQLANCQRDRFLRRSNAAKHFAASAIKLNADQQSDLVVQAQTPCFMGAHNTIFWIFARSNRNAANYNLKFELAADFLEILSSSTKGFRDLETASHTAVELYTIKWKFDGEKYQQSECTVTDENDKTAKVECQP
ncbi:MAG: DUF1176 domain-containing protein [Acidobacteriota bacterium]|nr:DUF1176 domain-containing protein [Acidobacteriota bacterium]